MMRKIIKLNLFLFLFLFLLGSFFSCKRYPDPSPIFEKYKDSTVKDNGRNVLLIVVDGVSGQVLKDLATPNIDTLINHGKYSYNVLPSFISTDASTWVSLMTGISSERHQIQDSSFRYISSGFTEGDNIGPSHFFTFFNYIYPDHPEYKMAVVTPWKDLSDYLSVVNHNVVVNDDEQVKDSTISVLQSTPRPGVVVADFNGAEIAGYESGGFTSDFIGYKTTILQIDEYIGDIMETLKQRTHYDKEDWLVMVTTNHGGSIENPKPGFIVCSNPLFKKEEIKKSGFSAVALTEAGDKAVYATMNPVVEGKRVYDFQKDFTLQFNVFLPLQAGWFPNIIGNKFALYGPNKPGFAIKYNYNPLWMFSITSGDYQGNNWQINNSQTITGDVWHSMGITVENNNGNRVVSTYMDGVFLNKGTLPPNAQLNSDIPLTIGWAPYVKKSGYDRLGDYATIYVHNIKLFNVALSQEEMKESSCVEGYSQLDNVDNLVGFWTCDEGGGGAFFNSINKNCPFLLHGNFKWERMEETLPCSVNASSLTDENVLSIVPSNSDVAANIFYWLGIKIKAEWKLDGHPWLDNFETEFIK